MRVIVFFLIISFLTPTVLGSFGVSPVVIHELPTTLHIVNGDMESTIEVVGDVVVFPQTLRLNPFERGQFYVEGVADVIEVRSRNGDIGMSISIPVFVEGGTVIESGSVNGLGVIIGLNVIGILGAVLLWKKKRY